MDIKVKEIMRIEIDTLSVPNSRAKVLELIKEKDLKLVPIIQKDSKKLVGIVSHTELIKNMEEDDLAMLMNRNPVTIQENDTVSNAIRLIIEKSTKILVVLKREELAGILTIHLIIKNVLSKKNFKDPIKSLVKTGITPIWDGTPIQIGLYIMQIAGVSVIPCVDDSGQLSGVVSVEELIKDTEIVAEKHASSLSAGEDDDRSWNTSDILLITKKKLKLANKLIRDIMIKRTQIKYVNELTSIQECANVMSKFSLDQLIVLDVNDALIGMIYDIDLIKVLLS